jgi:hypothetical protein
LAVHVHFHGRHNSGQPIYAGFSHPIVLRRGPRKEQPLAVWQVSPIDTRKWLAGELDAAPAVDPAGWTEVDLSLPNQHCGPAGIAHHHEVRWYLRTVRIPAAFRRKSLEALAKTQGDTGVQPVQPQAGGLRHLGPPNSPKMSLFLECPPVEEAWAYADGQRLGRTLSATSTTFDLTPVADRPTVDLLIGVRHNWHFWIERFGLSGVPRLVSPGQVLSGTWHLRGRPLATPEPWTTILADGWQKDATAMVAARRVCVRCPVRVSVPAECAAPLFIELDGWVSRAVLYWNGQPLGLYSEVGPQKRFYIPEHLIQAENTVHVLVDGYRGPATLGTIAAGFYFQNRRISVTLT